MIITTSSEFDSANIAQHILVTHCNHNPERGVTFVDVGAGQPQFYSNSHYFRSNTDSVIVSIDANPNNCKMFYDSGLEALHYAVVKEDGMGDMTFREYPNNISGLSYSSLAYHSEPVAGCYFVEYDVPTLSLTSILKKHYPKIISIDILDVDTEGNELDVLCGLDFEYYKPKVLIIENTQADLSRYHAYYESIGYIIVAKCAHNEILIKK